MRFERRILKRVYRIAKPCNYYTGAEPLVTPRGEMIGVRVKRRSNFTLYFQLDFISLENPYDQENGNTKTDMTAAYLVNNGDFKCIVYPDNGVIDDIYANAIELSPRVSAWDDETLRVDFDMAQPVGDDNLPLDYGIYGMELSVSLDDARYEIVPVGDYVISVR